MAMQALVMGFGGTGAHVLTALKELTVLKYGRVPETIKFLLFDTIADWEPGINVQIVPFRTSADMATGLLRGDIDVMFEFYTAAHGLLSDKRAVALVSTGPKRSAYLPDVPTAIETGLKDYEVLSWNGISVPAATPQAVIDTLVKGINDVLPDPSIQEKAKSLGMDMHGGKPADMDKRMKDDIVKWGAVIEKAGIPKRD